MEVALIFIKKYWTHILLAAVVAASLLYVNNLRMTIERQKTEIVQLKADNETLTATNKELQNANQELALALETQTRAVKQLVADSDAKLAASAAALSAAKAETARLQKKYASILNAPAPVTGDDCKSTSILLEQYITLRREELRQ